MKSITVFLDIAKFSDIWWKNADFRRTLDVCYVTHIFFGYSFKV